MDPNVVSYPGNSPEDNQSFRSRFTEFIETLIIFITILAVVYFVIARPHKVFGSSMYPNFHSGDYIITDELSYKLGNPQRGQVIVFKDPLDLSQDFIKRIIGLPGETVKVANGHVYVNSKLLQEPYLDSSVVTVPRQFMEEDNGHIRIPPDQVTVPPDHYFVLGDNRPDSSDSREWGFITREEIIGKAFFRYWPQDEIGLVPTVHYPNP